MSRSAPTERSSFSSVLGFGVEIPLNRICESLALPPELASSLEEKGWNVKRLGIPLHDADNILLFLLDQLNLFADLSWKSEASSSSSQLAEAFVERVVALRRCESTL